MVRQSILTPLVRHGGSLLEPALGPVPNGLETGFGAVAGFGIRIGRFVDVVPQVGIKSFDRDDADILLWMGLDEHTIRVLELTGGGMTAVDAFADLRILRPTTARRPPGPMLALRGRFALGPAPVRALLRTFRTALMLRARSRAPSTRFYLSSVSFSVPLP